MKKLLKIFTYFIIIVIVLAIVLTIVAKLSEDKITEMVLKKISENIEAPVKIDNVSFSLLRKFPLATIELNNVLLGAHKTPNGSDSIFSDLDTIMSIQKIYVSVKSKPLFKGIIEVKKLDINVGMINYFVDTSGVTNIDFLIASSDTTGVDTLPSKPLDLTLTDLSVKNLICNYNDLSLKAKAKLVIPELKVKAKVKGENILASAKGEITLTNCSFEETNLQLMNKTNLHFNVDYENDSISIKQLDIFTDGANLNLLGIILLGDEIKTDLKIEGSDLILGELIKYAPKEMLKEYGLEQVSGKLNLDAIVKGTYSDIELPKVDLSINLKNGNIATTDYPILKNISFKGKITNGILRNNKSTQIDFSSFHFETKQSKFNLVFSVLDIDHPKYNVKADMDIQVGEFRKFIPDSLIQSINGNIKASFSTKGEIPDSISDDFTDYIMANTRANFELIGLDVDVDSTISIRELSGKIDYKPNNVEVTNLSLSIPSYQTLVKNTSFDVHFNENFENLSDMSLDLKSFQIEKESSVFSGSAKVQNFITPSYSITSNVKLNLDEVKKMLPDTLLNALSGKVFGDIQSSGTLNLDSISDQAMDIVFKSSSFKLNFENVSIEMPDYPLYTLKNISALVSMNPDSISIMKMFGIVAGFELEMDSTTIKNVYNTVIKNKTEQLTLNTRINLGAIDYSMFAPFMAMDSALVASEIKKPNSNNEELVEEPTHYTMLIKGVAKVKSFTYDKVFIEDVSTLFNIKDSVYTLDQLKFNAFKGKMNTSVKYTIKPDNRSIIEMRNIVERMDVKKLLFDFDNFEKFYEPSVTYENLSGLFSTDLHSRFVMIGDSMIQNDMRIRGTIKLENGGVYNFEPAMELSKFTSINELDNIQFKTLDSKIFIFKNSIFVPETYISSNALDISAYGMQSFGEDYEYHLQIHLGDILLGKSKKLLKQQSKMGDIASKDERRAAYIVSYSLDGSDKNGFDNTQLRDKMKNKIKVQETMLNLIFHPGMVNFDTKVYSNK